MFPSHSQRHTHSVATRTVPLAPRRLARQDTVARPNVSAALPLELTNELVATLHPLLVRIARRMVTQREDAEDVAQQTWLSALRSTHTYEGRSSILTWLVSIMRRRASDHRRRSGPPARQLLDDDWVVEGALLEELDARTRVASFTGVLPLLSALERAALLRCDVRQLERDQVAAELSISRGHLRVLLHRARGRMRDACAAREQARVFVSPNGLVQRRCAQRR